MDKDDMIEEIKKYYKSINRDKYPNMENYSIKELQKVCELFDLF